MILSDKNSNGIQFSKLTVVICLAVAVLGIAGSGVAAAFGLISETVAVAIITICGSVGVTAEVANLKKSQVENTIKIYLSAYKEISDLKADTEVLEEVKNNILSKMDDSINTSLEDATALIEKQEV